MSAEKQDQEELAPVLGFGATLEGTDSLVGQVISLNMKKGPFFMTGDIKLTPERYHTTVSEGMPIGYYETIRKNLIAGYIVRGKERILVIDRPEGVLEAWEAMITKEGRSKTSVAAFKELIRTKKDNGHSLAEIARYCLKQERNNKNREDVNKLLEQVLMYVDQESFYDKEVFDDEEGKIDISLTKGADGNYQLATTDSEYKAKPPQGHMAGQKSASDVLDNVLEL